MTDIRIPDLREPQRDADEQQIYDMAVSMQVDLTPAALLAAATRRTGLEDLGDPTLVDRLAAQVAAVDADEGLSGLGRYLIRRRLVGLLAARQRFEDFVRRYPEALGGPAGAPDHRRRPAPLRDDPPGQRPGQRHPAPVAPLVGDRRARPRCSATARAATGSTPGTCACWPTTRPAGRCRR